MGNAMRLMGFVALLAASGVWSATPTELLNSYTVAAGQQAQPDKGQRFFTNVHGKEWSCSSCHTKQPTVDGVHASTKKIISPLAPVANDKRFMDANKTEKWFRRNCNDVLGRECSPAEKADVLSWLMTLKP